jgi:hypothetical protein
VTLVDQEHHGRVGIEQVADPIEELVQQLPAVEVRERGLGDRLQALEPLA